MSIRHGLLALLDEGPRYGYQLRVEFEARTGATWPLNVGQVYTTLGRLERDGLVEPSGEDDEGHVFYAITEAGRGELRSWFDTPVGRDNPPRDELAIKLAMAVTVPGVDVAAVVQAQRGHTMRALQDYTRLKARAMGAVTNASGDERAQGRDLAWLLVLDQLIFQAEAEVRWLDHCETRLLSAASRRPAAGTPNVSPAVADPAVDRVVTKQGER
ncbi:DNA-binding PadR family transcriptional regulator [Streptacidiphilus sp. MAP12-33]|uniref:PadR family transcriptional regulator n=1 Tax=Streptacidiphilus sp. MAP12-33 TaxID=3156266 RepID=UPI003512F2AF